MRIICPKCGHERSGRDDPAIPETTCPGCGRVYAKAGWRSVRRPAPPRAAPGTGDYWRSVGVLSVLVSAAWLFFGEPSPREAKPRQFGEMDAVYLCQQALKWLAVDPETADIPYVPNHGRGSEYYFAWGHGTRFARMRNGLGLEVPVSASCIVDGASRRITGLTVNGEMVR